MTIILVRPDGEETAVRWDAVPSIGDTVAFSDTVAFIVEDVEWRVDEDDSVHVYLEEDRG